MIRIRRYGEEIAHLCARFEKAVKQEGILTAYSRSRRFESRRDERIRKAKQARKRRNRSERRYFAG